MNTNNPTCNGTIMTKAQEETAFALIAEILEITDTLDSVVGATKDHIIGSAPCPCCETAATPEGLLDALKEERAKLKSVLNDAQEVRDYIY